MLYSEIVVNAHLFGLNHRLSVMYEYYIAHGWFGTHQILKNALCS